MQLKGLKVMSGKIREAHIKFEGVRPLLFDRYTGSNEAKPEPIDKVYWHDSVAVIPQVNIYSALSAENTKSVTKMFFGKKAKPIGMAINTGLFIEQQYIPILQNGERISVDSFDDVFWINDQHVARINKSGTAIPNPKMRPQLDLPWSIEFDIKFLPSGDLTWEVMQQCFDYCGLIGLGTYRPLYGGFTASVC